MKIDFFLFLQWSQSICSRLFSKFKVFFSQLFAIRDGCVRKVKFFKLPLMQSFFWATLIQNNIFNKITDMLRTTMLKRNSDKLYNFFLRYSFGCKNW